MVDWARVDRLRSKGMGWEEIANDARVKFVPPEGVEDAGRALKTLYYSRKSASGSGPSTKGERLPARSNGRLRGFLVPGGITLLLMGLVWFPIAYFVSFVGVLVPAIPYVLLVLIAGAALLAAGQVLGTGRLSEGWKKPVALGLVLGLVISGGLALAGVGLGIPNLSNLTYSEPGGWQSETPRNSVWYDNGKPVVFYLGSIACPYCSATSWAFYIALTNFGTLSGIQLGSSNPNDTPSSIPEVEFVTASYASNYLSLDVKEGNDDSSTAVMPSLSLLEQSYVNTYDSHGDIPFFTVGGMFLHVGTLVDPTHLEGLTPQQVMNIVNNPSSNPTVYSDIHGPALYFEAYFVKTDQIAGIQPPSSVTSDPTVMGIVATIQ